jgi:hypothetical protein
MSDEDVRLIAGTDAALYIIFNRYAAIFFLFITMFNFLVFLPIYITGDPAKIEDIKDKGGQTVLLALFTSINISGNSDKQLSVFVLMIILYTIGAFVLIFFYWRKSVNWRYRKHSHQETFYDQDIALHTVIVTHLPKNIPAMIMTNKLREVFSNIYSDQKVVSTRCGPVFIDLYKRALTLRNKKRKYRFIKFTN